MTDHASVVVNRLSGEHIALLRVPFNQFLEIHCGLVRPHPIEPYFDYWDLAAAIITARLSDSLNDFLSPSNLMVAFISRWQTIPLDQVVGPTTPS